MPYRVFDNEDDIVLFLQLYVLLFMLHIPIRCQICVCLSVIYDYIDENVQILFNATFLKNELKVKSHVIQHVSV